MTDQPKWTPGPWRALDAEIVTGIGLKMRHLARAWRRWNVADEEETTANAHLIAAAPEMAEAMDEFCRRVEAGEIRSKKTYAQFRAILRKARGEA